MIDGIFNIKVCCFAAGQVQNLIKPPFVYKISWDQDGFIKASIVLRNAIYHKSKIHTCMPITSNMQI